MALALAEWTGSAIISSLVDTAFLYMGEHMLPPETKAELNRLKFALPKIKAVMNVSEALKFKYPNSGVIEWLHNFKQAFLAADDMLDELKYCELEDLVKNRNQVSQSSSSIVGSLKRKFSCSSTNSQTLGKLRVVVQMLDLAVSDVGDFIQFVTALNGPLLPHYEANLVFDRETSFLTESKVFGRENEKAKLIKWLKKPTSQTQISALSIIGAGGLGKTTLAQSVFEDISRENHFDETIWVWVSTSFHVKDVMRKILEHLNVSSDTDESLNGLQLKLKKKLHSKKIFVILDDVWDDNKMYDWEKLVAPLKFVQQGSKILLTTRMKSVAEILATVLTVKREYLHLRGLEEPTLLLLFNKYAFNSCTHDSHKDLQKIGNDIVKKLWGSPLAAKVIGSLLNSNMNFHYWRRILKYDSLLNLEQAKDIADVLKLSYYHLSADLQECFRFCSTFPQDHEFQKSELIRMWIASGFIREQSFTEENPEDVGEKYFNHLLKKSFFEQDHHLGYYKMHDLMHELAQKVSEGECLKIDANDKSINIPATIQHVSLPGCEIEKISHLRNLRTLIITKSKHIMFNILPTNSLKKTLRLLQIDTSHGCELPEGIGCLIHLRYLDVRFKSLLPHSIFKLYHLQVLKLFGHNFETTDLVNLVSLQHISVPVEISKSIKEIHKLTSLDEMVFYVGQEKGHHIDELKTLNNLRDLSIRQIENVKGPVEAKDAGLSKKESLTSLCLDWTKGSNCDNPEHIIDKLQPPSSVRNLTINGYEGHRSPIWMRDLNSLEYLSSLDLFDCPLWEGLPVLAQMPHLKTLYLSRMCEVKQLDYSVDNTRNACAFPSLEQLWCENLPKWQSWSGHNYINGFANLKTLKIKDCPVLAELPILPLSLSEFTVINVGISSIPEINHCFSNITPVPSSLNSSLKDVVIENCPNLKSLLNGFLHQDNINLHGLELLIIKACENLIQLPTSGFGKFRSLKYLCISTTPKLTAVDNQSIVLPVNLQSLHFGNCGELEMPLLESASHLTDLHEIYILNSASITYIPFSEIAFLSLSTLHIDRCDNLIEHSTMKCAQGLNPRNNLASLKIKNLEIPHLSLLSIEPLRSLRFVKQCRLNDCSGMEALLEQWLLQNSSSLELLYFNNASSLQSLPDIMIRLTVLRQLKIDKAWLLVEIPELPTTLEVLFIHNARSLRSLPSTITKLTALKELEINNADLLDEIPELPTTLQLLHICNAGSLQSLPDTMVKLTALRFLYISDANLLKKIPELPITLEELSIRNASSLQSLPDTIVRLSALRIIEIINAHSLKEIPELPTSLLVKTIKDVGGRHII